MDVNINVDKYNIEDGQTVIIHLPVEKMSLKHVQQYMTEVVTSFRDDFDKKNLKNVKLFAFPDQGNGRKPSLEVLPPPKPGSIVLISVPLGGISKSQRVQYLKKVKQSFESKWTDVEFIIDGVREDGSKIEVKLQR